MGVAVRGDRDARYVALGVDGHASAGGAPRVPRSATAPVLVRTKAWPLPSVYGAEPVTVRRH